MRYDICPVLVGFLLFDFDFLRLDVPSRLMASAQYPGQLPAFRRWAFGSACVTQNCAGMEGIEGKQKG